MSDSTADPPRPARRRRGRPPLPRQDDSELEGLTFRERTQAQRKAKNRTSAAATKRRQATAASLQQRVAALQEENTRLQYDLAAATAELQALRADHTTAGGSSVDTIPSEDTGAPSPFPSSFNDTLLFPPYPSDGAVAAGEDTSGVVAPGQGARPHSAPQADSAAAHAAMTGGGYAMQYVYTEGAPLPPPPSSIHTHQGRVVGGAGDDDLFPLVFTPFAAAAAPTTDFAWSPTRMENSHGAFAAWRPLSDNGDLARKVSAPAALTYSSTELPMGGQMSP